MKTKKRQFSWMMMAAAATICGTAWSTDVELVNVGVGGALPDDNSTARPYLSADGRYVAFSSKASNLVAGDDNGVEDVFVRDRTTNLVERVSVSSGGVEGNGWSNNPSISADGRYVAFNSDASNLVAGDDNDAWDTFVYDRQTDQIQRVSVDSVGNEGNQGYIEHPFTARLVPNSDDVQRYAPSISGDGRYVAFVSDATNLVAGDGNGKYDVFVHDRQTGTTERVSVASDGTEGDNGSFHASISLDGRYVVFNSAADNLVAGDTNGTWDTFVHDRQTDATERVSVASDGTQANGQSVCVPFISEDGRYVTFTSLASNLVVGDTNNTWDVFLFDRDTDACSRVSVAADDAQANGASYNSTISADGRYVAFSSDATNLTTLPAGAGVSNVYVVDRNQGRIWCASYSVNGSLSSGRSNVPGISADGQVVAFQSDASDLVSSVDNEKFNIFSRINIDPAFTLTVDTAPIATGNATPTSPTQVKLGDSQAITATPETDYHFVNWTVTSGTATIADASAASTSVTIASDATVTANFTHNTAVLTMAAIGTGTTNPAAGSTTTVQTQAATAIAATPGTDYHFVNWTLAGGGAVSDPSSPNTTVTLSGDATVTANFSHNTAILTMATAGSGSIVPITGQHTIDTKAATAIVATAATGYHFTGWTLSGNGVLTDSSAASTTVTLSGNSTVTANFDHDTATLILAVSPASAGSTNPMTGWNTTVSTGQTKTIIATASENYHFTGWTVSGSAIVADSSSTSTTVTLTSDATVTANFAHDTATLTMAVSGEGSTTPAAGSSVINSATATAISATANENHHFTGWTVTGSATIASANSANTTVTLSGDATVTANFAHDTATMTLAVSGEGSTTPAAGSSVINSATATAISATADENHHFTGWTVTGSATIASANSANTTVTLSGDATVTANFTRDTATMTMAVSGEGSTTPAAGSSVINSATATAISATADENHHFTGWTVTGSATIASANSANTTATLSGDATVTANFARDTATMTMAVSGEGSTTPAAGSSVINTATATAISATADENHHFTGWTVTGSATIASANSANTTVTLSGDATVTANFARDTATLTMASAPASAGTTSPNAGTTVVNTNEATSIKAIPAVNYHFLKWSVDGSAVVADATASETTVTLSGDGAVTANFTVDAAAVLALTSPNGGETLRRGTSVNITWSSTETIETVKIELVKDGATSVIVDSTENDGTYQWAIPDDQIEGSDYKINVSGTYSADGFDTAVSDESDKVFSIVGTTYVSLISPNGGETLVRGETTTIQWESANLEGRLTIALTSNEAVSVITADAENSGSYDWTLSDDLPLGSDYGIKIYSNDDATVFDVSDGYFIISNGTSSNLNLAAYPEGTGSVSPATGEMAVSNGVPTMIVATANDGYAFKEWRIEGNATVSDTTAIETTVTLSGDATATALFVIEENAEVQETLWDKVVIDMDTGRENNDRILIRKCLLPDGLSRSDVENGDFTLLVDDYKLEMPADDGESKIRPRGNHHVFDLDGKSRVSLTFRIDDEERDTWTLRANNLDMKNQIDYRDGVDVYLVIGDKMFGGNLTMNENVKWRMTSTSPLTVAGSESAMNNFDALKAQGAEVGGSRDSITIRKGTMDVIEEFDPVADAVTVTIDDWSKTFVTDTIRSVGRDKWKFVGKTYKGESFKLLLNFKQGMWRFHIANADLREKVYAMDGIDVKLSVGDAQGSVRMTVDQKITLEFQSAAEQELSE